jgi:protoheme IX farnesyltransferase
MNAAIVRQFYALMKPRVIQLIVFCAVIGMVLAVPGLPTLEEVRVGAIAALRHLAGRGRGRRRSTAWSRKGIDAKMRRTAWRPHGPGAS